MFGWFNRAAAFYGEVLGLPCIHEDHRMRAYDVGGNGGKSS